MATPEQAAAADQPPPPPTPLRCAFFVPTAGRACGLNVSRRRLVPGHPPLCPQHEPGAERARVPCPVDPSHTVARGGLKDHLARCTAALRAAGLAAQPWYARGVNSGGQQRRPRQQPEDAAEEEEEEEEEEEGGWETDAWSGPSEGGGEEEEEEGEEAAEGANADADKAAANAAARERARPFRAAVGAHAGRAKRRAAIVNGLGFEGFAALVARLDAAHARLVAGKHPPLAAREGWRAACCGRKEEAEEEEEAKDDGEDEEDAAAITLALRARAREYDPMMPVDGKHARQHAAVAAVLRARGLLPTPPDADEGGGGGGGGGEGGGDNDDVAADLPPPRAPVLVELGAGKGYLTAWLVIESSSRSRPPPDPSPANPPPPPPFRALVMVDAAGHMACKADRRLRGAAPLLARVTADLRDVDLSRLPGVVIGSGGSGEGQQGDKGLDDPSSSSSSSVLAVGKHLCGVATDYALRAFARAVVAVCAAGHERQQNRPPMRGAVAVATCCHHRGRWRDFCGRDAWRGVAGLSRADFECALWLCGWANSPGAAASAAPPPPEGTPRAWHRRLEPSPSSSGAAAAAAGGCPDAALGRRCRELLDAARCAWLEARLLRAEGGREGPAEREGGGGGGGGGISSSSPAAAAAAPAAAPRRKGRVEHLFFVGPSVTPENRLILGVVD